MLSILFVWEVSPVKKFVVILMMVGLVMSSRGATAQDLFESQTLGELPPQVMMPDLAEPLSISSNKIELPGESIGTIPAQEPLSLPTPSSGEMAPSWDYFMGQDLQLFSCQPAILESTGTWLRRGFWSAEVDAVIMNRTFSNNRVLLASDFTANLNALSIRGDGPGAEGTPRLTLSRFLFRDDANRDHNLEFVAWGGGNWSQQGQLTGEDLEVPIQLDGFNPSFDGAQSTQYKYDSWFNNFELNYHVKQRMLKDRMELEPSGHWVRRAQPSRSNAFLAGMRFFNLNEQLYWNAFGIPDVNNDNTTETGTYYVNTNNVLIGTQLGVSSTYETARWSGGVWCKGGMYLNIMDVDSAFNVTGNVTSGETDLQGDNIAFIGQAGVLGKYHIRPNLSLRAGLEVMLINHLAVAPSQLDFVPSGRSIISSGSDNYYMGGSIGFESYW